MGKLLQFEIRPERKAELEKELDELETRVDEILHLLGYVAIKEPLPEIK